MELRQYDDRFFLKVVDFYIKGFPNRVNQYESMVYKIQKMVDKEEAKENVFVINEQDDIIGANMLLPVKFLFGDKLLSAVWSYDTLVLPEYRKSDAGLLITEYVISRNNLFGVGLSPINKKIFKKVKLNFIGVLSTYIYPNLFSVRVLSSICPLILPKKVVDYVFPEQIKVREYVFEKVNNISDFRGDESGYCSSDIIEFSHNEDFVRRRYFCYPGKYTVYQMKEGIRNKFPFFVVRPIVVKNMNCLLLVDYRMNMCDPSFFKIILKATNKLVRITWMGATVTAVSLDRFKYVLRKFPWVKIKRADADIVTNYTKEKLEVLVTPGDSDYDFFYGNNVW